MIPNLLTRLEAWLKEHRPEYLAALLPGAKPAELKALQQALKMPLPNGLRDLLSWHNGQKLDYPERFE